MTANELADWIENSSPYGDYATAKKAVAMLRQQQAEIEQLKALAISLSPNANLIYTKASEK